MADPIAREHELDVLAEEGRRFIMDRGARRARQMILEAKEKKTKKGSGDAGEQAPESAGTPDETQTQEAPAPEQQASSPLAPQ